MGHPVLHISVLPVMVKVEKEKAYEEFKTGVPAIGNADFLRVASQGVYTLYH